MEAFYLFSVQNYIKKLRAAAAKCITDQQNLLKMELLKIPKVTKLLLSVFILPWLSQPQIQNF